MSWKIAQVMQVQALVAKVREQAQVPERALGRVQVAKTPQQEPQVQAPQVH